MSFLTNSWVGYVHRSAAQILTNMLVNLGAKVPEMTDHSLNNIYVRNLEQFAAINEQLGYYVDNAARESFLLEARLYKSGINKAREYDYRVIGNVPFSTDIQIAIDAPAPSLVKLVAGSIVSNADGSIRYRVLQDAAIQIGNMVSNIVPAIQSEIQAGVTMNTSTGSADLEVVFTDKVVHNSIVVQWDAVAWQRQETLYYSDASDTDYIQDVNGDGDAVVIFGNGLPFGKVPVSGQVMTANYETTLGADGYVGQGELDTVASAVPTLPVGYTLTVTNVAQSTGGSNVESLLDLQRHIPLFERTKDRALTLTDFEDVAMQAPGVANAGASYSGKRAINVYIVPVGGGVASSLLITNTQTFLNIKRVAGTYPVVKPAGEVHLLLVIDLVIKPTHPRTATAAVVKTNLTNLLNYVNQTIGGTVHQSDIYEEVETTPGVANSNITKFAVVPYPRPLASAPPLIWTPVLLSNALPAQYWKIVFVTGSTFKLIKNSTLVGTYSTGVTVTTPQFTFNIPVGSYSNGNSYEFYTYPYNASSVSLLEPSLLVSTSADIVLNTTGGY